MTTLNGFVKSFNTELIKSTVISFYNITTGTLGNLPGVRFIMPRRSSNKKNNYLEQNGSIAEESSDDETQVESEVANGTVANGTVSNGTVHHAPVVECLEKRLKPVVFEWMGPERDKVAITGDFYNWQVQVPLNRKSKKFAAQIDLPKGRHEFKFVVNGTWKYRYVLKLTVGL